MDDLIKILRKDNLIFVIVNIWNDAQIQII